MDAKDLKNKFDGISVCVKGGTKCAGSILKGIGIYAGITIGTILEPRAHRAAYHAKKQIVPECKKGFTEGKKMFESGKKYLKHPNSYCPYIHSPNSFDEILKKYK